MLRSRDAMTRRRGAAAKSSPAKGIYANYFEVGHTAFEFVLDFGARYAGSSSPCHTRIVTSPTYAHALLVTLGKALSDYETQFGKADEPPVKRVR